MDERILKCIMERLHDISLDACAIQDLTDAPLKKEAGPEERKWRMELKALISKIKDAQFEAYGKCYLTLNKN